jgi:predicted aspartyl protease
MFNPYLAAFIASLSLTSAAAAQTTALQTPVCGKASLANMVALKQVPDSNLMTVPVAINGTPKQFLLDIGANPDEISEASVAELNLPQVDLRTPVDAMAEKNSTFQFQAPVFDVRGTATARNYQPRVRAAAFTMGEVTLQNLQFLVANDRDMGKTKPYDGRLTAAGFRQYDINFDFGGKTLSFLAANGCPDPNQIAYWPHATVAVIPITMRNGKIGVPVMIRGQAIDAVIDMGSDHTVMRRDIAERMFGLKADTPDMTPDGDIRDGACERVYQHIFPQIAFDDVVASNVPVLIQDNSMVRPAHRATMTGSRLPAASDPGERIPDLALGMDVMHQLHVYAAFGQNKLYVTPAG